MDHEPDVRLVDPMPKAIVATMIHRRSFVQLSVTHAPNLLGLDANALCVLQTPVIKPHAVRVPDILQPLA